jgi:hypothetical protein
MNAQKAPGQRRIALVTVCVLCAVLSAAGQRPNSSTSAPDQKLKQFLRRHLSDPQIGEDKTTRFSSAPVKRNDGTIGEIVVYISGQSWCGSGGCTLLILEPHDSSYKIIGRTSIVRLPIRRLHHITNGHHDIGVWVQGGGIQPGYEAALRFDGKTYPGNPTIKPAQRLSGKTAGDMLIADTNSKLLFD